VPDDEIDFEDLMIFSMNYNNTFYTRCDRGPRNEEQIALTITRYYDGEELVVELDMHGNEGFVHGLNVPLVCGSQIELNEIIKGDVWNEQDFFIYTWENQLLEISGAALGAESVIDGNGRIATLRFSFNGESTESDFGNASARNAFNEEIGIIYNPILGVQGQDQNFNMLIYPNPASDRAEMLISSEQPQRISAEIFNLSGQKVAAMAERTIGSGKTQLSINTTALSEGVYILRITTAHKQYSQRLIICR
jgi:hypothetical protein